MRKAWSMTPLPADAPAGLDRLGRSSGRCRGGHAESARIVRVRKMVIGTSERTSRTTAMAEPNPIRLASLMLLLVIRIDKQLQAVLAAVGDVRDVEGAQRFDDGDDDDDDVDRAHDREDHLEEGLPLARAVDGGRLPEGRVDALEPGQVEDHHVADVAPAGRDQDRPDVERRVPEPVDDVVLAGPAQDVVDEPLRRVHLFPDEPDDRQRQDDRDEERALVDPRAAHLTVQQDGEEDPDRRRDEHERQQPQDVVPDGRPEERIGREQLLVVLQADEVLRGQRAGPTPVRERQAERGDRRQPDEREAQEGRDADHQRHRHLVAPGQHRIAPTLARRNGSRPTRWGDGQGGRGRLRRP